MGLVVVNIEVRPDQNCAEMFWAEISFISAETIGFLPVSGGFIRHVLRFTDNVGLPRAAMVH